MDTEQPIEVTAHTEPDGTVRHTVARWPEETFIGSEVLAAVPIGWELTDRADGTKELAIEVDNGRALYRLEHDPTRLGYRGTLLGSAEK